MAMRAQKWGGVIRGATSGRFTPIAGRGAEAICSFISMNTITFDESRWPLVVVRYDAKVDENEFEELLSRLDKNVRKAASARQKTALIYDSTSGYQASPRIRKRQAEWMKANAEATRLNCAGIGFVINSSLVRGVLTAILWLSDMPAPYTVVGTLAEAEDWCEKELGAHGVTLPSAGKPRLV